MLLLFGAGLVASLGGRPDRVAAERLRALLDARAVQVVRGNGQGDQVVAAAGEPLGELDLLALPHLDDEGRLPSGHLRSVGGTLVVRGRRRGGRPGPRPHPGRLAGGGPAAGPADPALHPGRAGRRRARPGELLTRGPRKFPVPQATLWPAGPPR